MHWNNTLPIEGLSAPRLSRPVTTRDHLLGPIDAPIVLLEYGNYECAASGALHSIIKETRNWLGNDLCYAFRHLPLTQIHPHSAQAAEAAEAAGAQGMFWQMHDILFENQDALEDEDFLLYADRLGLASHRILRELLDGIFSTRVWEDFRSGIMAGANGTPALFINGVRYDGARELDELLEALTQH